MTDAPPCDRVTYLGHATVLLEIGGSRILTDPILRNRLVRSTRSTHACSPSSRRGARARGRSPKAGSKTLRWAAVEAAQQAWRPTRLWHEL